MRNAVWDHQHGREPSPPHTDVDVIWYDPHRFDPATDAAYEAMLREAEPSIVWSVKNQARMHTRNGDLPYRSAPDAMMSWPDTATAIAVRRTCDDRCDLAAPFGVDDLLGLRVRPTPHFARAKLPLYRERLRLKQWTAAWPGLDVHDA